MLWVLAMAAASAAEVTDMPSALQGSAALQYDGFVQRGGLEELGERIADREIRRHDLNWVLEFAPTSGVALTMDIDHTPSLSYAYPNARNMTFEPTTGAGTYLFGRNEKGTPELTASGLNGVWFGAALSPFSEDYDLNHRATWRLDMAFRTGAAKKNMWTAKDGKRGTSPGGAAMKLVGAFSAVNNAGNPYLQVSWQKEMKVNIDVIDEDGTKWATKLDVQPASTLKLHGGIEVAAYEDRELGIRVALDLFATGGYRSWEDVVSGVYLPSVLDTSRTINVTASERLFGHAGVGVDVHATDAVRGRTGMSLGYETPWRPEHVYADVNTTRAGLIVGWFFTIQGNVDANQPEGNDPLEPLLDP